VVGIGHLGSMFLGDVTSKDIEFFIFFLQARSRAVSRVQRTVSLRGLFSCGPSAGWIPHSS
jgi:hypothetical protein